MRGRRLLCRLGLRRDAWSSLARSEWTLEEKSLGFAMSNLAHAELYRAQCQCQSWGTLDKPYPLHVYHAFQLQNKLPYATKVESPRE